MQISNYVAMQFEGIRQGSPEHKEIIDTYNNLRDAGSYKMSYNDPWCAAFVSVALANYGMPSMIPFACSCSELVRQAIKLGYPVDTVPAVDAIIIYNYDNDDIMDHCGIVKQIDGNILTVIEGNYSDCVTLVKRDVNSRDIACYIHLPTSDDTTPIIRYGSVGPWVTALQALLVANGYGVGPCGLDGDAGDDTICSLRSFQSASGINITGETDVNTWRALCRIT